MCETKWLVNRHSYLSTLEHTSGTRRSTTWGRAVQHRRALQRKHQPQSVLLRPEPGRRERQVGHTRLTVHCEQQSNIHITSLHLSPLSRNFSVLVDTSTMLIRTCTWWRCSERALPSECSSTHPVTHLNFRLHIYTSGYLLKYGQTTLISFVAIWLAVACYWQLISGAHDNDEEFEPLDQHRQQGLRRLPLRERIQPGQLTGTGE